MGTTYGILQGDSTEIELDERSNTLELYIRDSGGNEVHTERFTPEQIISAALEMLKVCSYWTEEGAVEKAIAEFKSKGYSW